MSSPSTVITMCLPLMQPCHTHGHAIPSRQLQITECPCKLFLRRACRASCISTARTCARHLPGSPLAAVRPNTHLRAGAQKYALRTHRPVPQNQANFPPRSTVAISDSTTFSGLQRRRPTRTTLPSRASCIPSQPTSRGRWASLVAPCQSPPILS